MTLHWSWLIRESDCLNKRMFVAYLTDESGKLQTKIGSVKSLFWVGSFIVASLVIFIFAALLDSAVPSIRERG